MKTFRRIVPNSLFGLLTLPVLVFCLGAGNPAPASPVTFEAKVFTDVGLGGVHYHNVDLTLTFVGDSSNVLFNTDPNAHLYDCNGNDQSQDTTDVLSWITTGTATLRFESNGKLYTAKINAGQLFVSQHESEGIGFGSFIGASCFEPIYPLAFVAGGQAGTSNAVLNSPTAVRVSGNALSCAGGYLNDPAICQIEPPPLKTDHGDFVVYFQYFVPTSAAAVGDSYYGYIPPQGFVALDCHHSCVLNHGTFSMTPGAAAGN